jgi:hypothetical protein
MLDPPLPLLTTQTSVLAALGIKNILATADGNVAVLILLAVLVQKYKKMTPEELRGRWTT